MWTAIIALTTFVRLFSKAKKKKKKKIFQVCTHLTTLSSVWSFMSYKGLPAVKKLCVVSEAANTNLC